MFPLIADVKNTNPLALRIAWQQGKEIMPPPTSSAEAKIQPGKPKEDSEDDIIPFDQWNMPPQEHGIIKAPTYDLF